MSPPNSSDVIVLNNLHFTKKVGTDHWGKQRPQPVSLSVYLYLAPSYLSTAGQSDNIKDTVNYGELAKSIIARVNSDPEGFRNVYALVDAVTDPVMSVAQNFMLRVRVVVDLPKAILLARGGMTIEDGTSRLESFDTPVEVNGGGPCSLLNDCEHSSLDPVPQHQHIIVQHRFRRDARTIYIRDLTLPVLIGVNEHERETRQLLSTHLTFYEIHEPHPPDVPEYPSIVKQITEMLSSSAYLTLEKLVFEMVHMAIKLGAPFLDSVTVRAEKPSAVNHADSSGVEMTRRAIDFMDRGGK